MSGAYAPLAVFALLFGCIFIYARRHPLLRTLAIREATRRLGQTALVIGGLMVGTATITAAMIGADSVGASTIEAFAYRNYGYVDVIATANNSFFDQSTGAAIAGNRNVDEGADGAGLSLEIVGSAANLTRKLGTTRVTLAGYDAGGEAAFGRFELSTGRSVRLSDLAPGDVLVSRKLAEQIDARAGDTLAVAGEVPARIVRPGRGGGPFSQRIMPPTPQRGTVRIAGIAKASGPGAYTLGPVVFAPLGTLQEALSTEAINVVRLSAPGGIRDTGETSKPLVAAAKKAAAQVSSEVAIVVRNAKARAVELGEDSTVFFRAMLLGLSSIVIAAGAALVVNITGMLAEERRTRLGVLRALGLRRRQVIGLSVIEGALYAAAAAVVGAAIGIPAGRLIAERFGKAFAEFAGEDVDFEFFFALRPETVLTAFAAGGVLTMLVIVLAARRTSRMTITAAIRDLPEPPAGAPRRRWPRIAGRVAGALLGVGGLASGARPLQMLGGLALTLVASAVAKPRLPARLHATLTGVALTAVALAILWGESGPETDPEVFFTVFVLGLLASVYGLTVAVIANLPVIDRIMALPGRTMGRLRAVLRPPLAYLSRRPTRTGLTTGVFALIISMLTLFSIFYVVFRPAYDTYGRGYDVRVLSTAASAIALPGDVPGDVVRTLEVPTRGYVGPLDAEGGFSNAERIFVPLFTVPADAAARPPVSLEQRAKQYASDDAAWTAVLRDPAVIIGNFAPPGAKVTLRDSRDKKVTYVIAASQSFGLLDGFFMNAEALKRFSGAPAGVSVLVDLRDSSKATLAARAIERSLFERGVDADSVQELLDQADRANRAIFSTLDVLMRLGLIVGILSLGIVALRLVTERRHVIGVMRAIGYRRRSVMGGLLAEATATATIGVAVGATVGTLMGYIFWKQSDNPPAFGIDWANFLGVLAVVYVATLLVTIGPASRASKLPPAEAVRYSE